MNPSPLAYLALLVWAPIVVVMFARLRPLTAASLSFMGGILLLPFRIEFDFRGLPPINGGSITAFGALVGALLFAPGRLRRRGLGRPPPDRLLAVFLLAALATAAANGDPLDYGFTRLQGMSMYDGVAVAFNGFTSLAVPFLLGRLLVRRPSDLPGVFVAVIVVMLAYSIPTLWEIRMSPQLHLYIYGYRGSPFVQTVRGSGFRPMVLAGHGLTLAMTLASACVFCIALARMRRKVLRTSATAIAAYLVGVLVLCKSMAAILYVLFVILLQIWAPPRLQTRIAVALVALVFAYPLLRSAQIFPTQALVDAAAIVSEDRAESLAFRFDNEDLLLEHAEKRLWFGWGAWGRNRIYSPSGRDQAITDGLWIIMLGSQGLVGFLLFYGFMLAGVVGAARRVDRLRDPLDRQWLATLSVMVALFGVNSLPSAGLDLFATFLAGSLAGAVWSVREPAQRPVEEPVQRAVKPPLEQ